MILNIITMRIDRRVAVTLSMPEDLLDAIDERRGLVKRSPYIVDMLKKAVETRKK
jgi:metal-responsive CopG/Arc/MetJ family transcriptional regulator